MIFLVGDSHAFALRAPLSAALGVPVQLDAEVGTDTDDWSGRAGHAGDLIFVVLGTNDIYKGIPPERSAQNAALILQAQSGTVIWVGAPAYANDRGTCDALATAVPNYLDSRGLGLAFRDGVHPTSPEYTRWANWIAAQASGAALPAQSVGDYYSPPDPAGFDPYAQDGSESGNGMLAVVGLVVLVTLGLAILRRRT